MGLKQIIDGIIHWKAEYAPSATPSNMLVMVKIGDNIGVIISPAADKGRTVFIL